jgi:hypothetical protein
MVFGQRRGHDEVQTEVAKAMESERTSGFSRCNDRRWPEVLQVTVICR